MAPVPAPAIEGHLHKAGHSALSALASWKRRLFVLRLEAPKAKLDYYDDEKSPRALKGSVDLGRGARVLDAPVPDCSFVVIDAKGTRYPLQAGSTPEKVRWMRTLKAVVDYGDGARVNAAWAGEKKGTHVAIPVGADGVPRSRSEVRLDKAERKAERKEARKERRSRRSAGSRTKYAAAGVAVVVVLWFLGWLPFRPRAEAVLEATG